MGRKIYREIERGKIVRKVDREMKVGKERESDIERGREK